MGQRIVEYSYDVEAVLLWRDCSPALNLALADLQPLFLSGVLAVAGGLSLERGELSLFVSVRLLALEDVIEELDIHVGVSIAVL